MLADNLRDANLTQAVQRTFDGKHPCTLCKQISAGKKAEKKSEFSSVKKLEFVSSAEVRVYQPAQTFYLLPNHVDSFGELAHRPPSPPPRSLTA
jgi:hypothetical protein